MLTNAKQLLTQAKQQGVALAALNSSTIEGLQAIFEAASELALPVIISPSENESKHLLPELVVKICAELAKMYPVEYVLHLDHGKDLKYVQHVLEAGYNSVHVDYSEIPLAENLEKTIQARKITDNYNAQLEGEVGIIPNHYYEIKGDLEYTDPETAEAYVKATRVDSLAVSIGTEHGRLKRMRKLNIDVLRKINQLLPAVPLVLHGGSYQPTEEYLKAITNGIAKINVNAESRMAYTQTLKKNLVENPEEYAPFRLLKGAKEAMKEVAKKKISLFARQEELQAVLT